MSLTPASAGSDRGARHITMIGTLLSDLVVIPAAVCLPVWTGVASVDIDNLML